MYAIPAYRKKQNQTGPPPITDQNISKYTVSGKGKDLNIRDNNPYLYDNVD
jgi:hypothetical protein